MKEPTKGLAWDDFRLIKAVAEARSLPAAAALLGVDHSTVFRRLRQVEAMLGVALFERHRAGYTLTAAGDEVAALAARVDQDITDVTRRLAGREPSLTGEVRLTTSDSLLAHLLMPPLAELRMRHPGIRLDIVVGNAALNLSRRDADVAVRATDAPPDTLVGRRAARIAWALYGNARGFAAGQAAGLDHAAQSLWVCLGDNMAAMKVVQFVQRHVAPERVACKVDSVLGLAGAVEAGLGVAHMPCFVGDTLPSLVRLAPPEPDFAADLWLLTHPDLHHAPRVRSLLDLLGERISARRALIEGRTKGGHGA